MKEAECDFLYNYIQAINVHAVVNKALERVMDRRGSVAPHGPRHIVIIADDLSAKYGEA